MLTCVVLFDGTGDDDQKPNVSNVVKLRDGLVQDDKQLVIYEDGIGNSVEWKSSISKIYSELTGNGAHWVMDRAYDKLLNTLKNSKLKKGGTIDIVVGGFSRGSGLARHFINEYLNEEHFNKGLMEALNFKVNFHIKIALLFDTVLAFGIPIRIDDKFPLEKHDDWKFKIPPGTFAYHALSIDENRAAFLPTLVDKDDNTLEVWFAGNHTSVGGGLKHPNEVTSLGEQLPLRFLAKHAIAHNIRFNEKFLINNNLTEKEAGSEQPLGYICTESWKDVPLVQRQNRAIFVQKNDKPSTEYPIIHESVIRRIKQQHDYRPKSLMDLKDFYVLWDNNKLALYGEEQVRQLWITTVANEAINVGSAKQVLNLKQLQPLNEVNKAEQEEVEHKNDVTDKISSALH